jgi:hypothetical protein
MINWISVKDRKPSDDLRLFLVLAINGPPYICYRYKDEKWYDKDNMRMQIITHWAEINLPEEKK